MEKRVIPDGEPVDMSQVTLGELYTSEDMYRDMGIERSEMGVVFTDTVREVTIRRRG